MAARGGDEVVISVRVSHAQLHSCTRECARHHMTIGLHKPVETYTTLLHLAIVAVSAWCMRNKQEMQATYDEKMSTLFQRASCTMCGGNAGWSSPLARVRRSTVMA
eukprot:8369545-Pyramimonas_sp.AAC.1